MRISDWSSDVCSADLNGRRFVSGLPGSAAVDLNTIPADFIDRVEILTGGASAVYGSDAVAGVVHIITKKDFNGLTLDVQKGQTFDYKDDKKDKRSEEHTSELQSLMRSSYAVFCLNKKNTTTRRDTTN